MIVFAEYYSDPSQKKSETDSECIENKSEFIVGSKLYYNSENGNRKKLRTFQHEIINNNLNDNKACQKNFFKTYCNHQKFLSLC